MKRVYTDPRFPGLEVHNNGNNQFHVYEIAGNQMQEIDTFTTFSDHPKYSIPEEVAARRAKDYFDRMAQGQMGVELSDGGEFGDNRMPGGIDSDMPGQEQAPEGEFTGPSSLGDMVDNVMTADDVIAAYERAKQLPEGPQRDAAMAQVKSMGAQLESAASELVRNLLD